ncbi:MAG: hypothetical protein AAGM22_03590 [Acidobacteriota bacterium]
MRIEIATTTIQATVTRDRESAELTYARLPDVTWYWAMARLTNAPEYRIAHGPKQGYVRTEMFFSLVRAAIAPCEEVRLLQELVDGVIFTATDVRPLFECTVLMGQVAHQMNQVAGTPHFPFALKLGLGFGVGKRVLRSTETFAGAGLDRLSRIMLAPSEAGVILADDEAYRVGHGTFEEYADIVAVSPSKELNGHRGDVPDGAPSVFYRELRVDRQALLETRDRFGHWIRQPGLR